jgi:hypothetical protein
MLASVIQVSASRSPASMTVYRSQPIVTVMRFKASHAPIQNLIPFSQKYIQDKINMYRDNAKNEKIPMQYSKSIRCLVVEGKIKLQTDGLIRLNNLENLEKRLHRESTSAFSSMVSASVSGFLAVVTFPVAFNPLAYPLLSTLFLFHSGISFMDGRDSADERDIVEDEVKRERTLIILKNEVTDGDKAYMTIKKIVQDTLGEEEFKRCSEDEINRLICEMFEQHYDTE